MTAKINKTVLLILGFLVFAIILNFILSGFGLTPAALFYEKPGRFTGLISPYYYSVLIILGINVILSVSLALLNGFTGLFTMGHAGFMAIGAYSSASVVMFALPNAPFIVQLIVGSITAGVVAGAVGVTEVVAFSLSAFSLSAFSASSVEAVAVSGLLVTTVVSAA